jgi:hypothetical protein
VLTPHTASSQLMYCYYYRLLVTPVERRYGISPWATVFVAPFLLLLLFSLYVAFFYWLCDTTLHNNNNTASSN